MTPDGAWNGSEHTGPVAVKVDIDSFLAHG
jgi:hypothetical protein